MAEKKERLRQEKERLKKVKLDKELKYAPLAGRELSVIQEIAGGSSVFIDETGTVFGGGLASERHGTPSRTLGNESVLFGRRESKLVALSGGDDTQSEGEKSSANGSLELNDDDESL